jgi:hypothetical protein
VRTTTRLLPTRWLTLALALTVSASVLFSAAPAGAVVVEVGGTKIGMQRHSTLLVEEPGAAPASFNNASGNPVLHRSNTYAIYWDPTAPHYHGDWMHLINGFLENLGAASGSTASVFAVDAQYTDKSNLPASYSSSFHGSYPDTKAYPAPGCKDPEPMAVGDALTCLTDKQIREELESFVAAHSLPKGMGTIFYLLTPPGVTVCADAGASASHCSSNSASANSFCSYHSAINPGGLATGDANTILYAAIPWSAGGVGDFHLQPVDQNLKGYDCQDGGFDPSGKSPEQKEKAKKRTEKEEGEFPSKNKEEKELVEKRELSEGPRVQEPNQVACPTSDGSCDTGLADVIINQIAVEHQNIVTDPLLNAWQDPAKNEATDECRNFFAPITGGSSGASEFTGAGNLFNQGLSSGNYYLNTAFNLAAYKLPYPAVPCIPGVNLIPQFTPPNPVNAGEIIGFNGMESDVTLNGGINFPGGGAAAPNYATYSWSLGDGSPTVSGYAPGAPTCTEPWLSPCAGGVFHSYQYGGQYNVTLTITDLGGNTASVSHVVTVVGPSPPSKEATTGASTGSAAAGSSAGATGAAGGSPAGSATPYPRPVATAAILSRTLRSLRNGVVVRYSVNEQVAGHFEVLLDRSVARRLGISGPAAVGLAPGSSPAIVIGHAILVTTKAGRNTMKIVLTQRTSNRLAGGRRLALTLRLIVRNADPHTPATTTVTSSTTLSR